MVMRKGLGKNRGMGYKNLIPKYDSNRHSLNARGYKMPQHTPNLRFGGKAEDRTTAEDELIKATDEETLKQIQKELDFKDGDLTEFREEQSGVYAFTIGSQDYYLFDDEDTAEQFAKDRVLEDLEDQPEIFTQSWLEGHIDTENLKDQLESDVSNSNYDYYNDIADESDNKYQNRQIAELVEGGYLDEDDVFDAEGNLKDEVDKEIVEKAIEEAVEKKTEEELEDPIEYLENIYGKPDAMKEAIRIGGINYDEAADDAISVDGWQHFIASYDGNSIDLPNGKVLARTN